MRKNKEKQDWKKFISLKRSFRFKLVTARAISNKGRKNSKQLHFHLEKKTYKSGNEERCDQNGKFYGSLYLLFCLITLDRK